MNFLIESNMNEFTNRICGKALIITIKTVQQFNETIITQYKLNIVNINKMRDTCSTTILVPSS